MHKSVGVCWVFKILCADYLTWRSRMWDVLRAFLFEKALGVLEIEEVGEPN